MKVKTKAARIRLTVQIVFFVLIALISINHSLEEAGKAIPLFSSASLHALCPLGGVVSIWQVAGSGTFVKKIHESSWILMWIGFAVAIFFGPAFCGWICPLGAIQEWLGKLGKKLFKKRYNSFIPSKVDSVLRYTRYGVLGILLYLTIRTGTLIFADYDPYFSWHLGVIVPAIFAVGIGSSMALNLWKTESSKVPATFTEGKFEGAYNPGDIRGSYSFQEISDMFDVPVAALTKAFGVDTMENPGEFKTKELEDMYGSFDQGEIGTDAVRYFTALYTGLPYTPEEDTYLLTPALSVLKERVPEELLESLKERTVNPKSFTSDERGASPDTPDAEDRLIKGLTTFGEVYSWGVSEEEVKDVIGFEPGKQSETIREYVTAQGIEFSSIKGKLQELIDSE